MDTRHFSRDSVGQTLLFTQITAEFCDLAANLIGRSTYDGCDQNYSTYWEPMPQPLNHLATTVAKLLSEQNRKVVFAESCTGGLVSAVLARVPGISNFHCGSAVVYRLDTKTQWLGVPQAMLVDPGPVSEPVARAMADGVLMRTPEADTSAAITGHLGPNAPPQMDGLVYIGVSVRGESCEVTGHWLPGFDASVDSSRTDGDTEREQRQWAAAQLVLEQLAAKLRSRVSSDESA